MEEFPGNSHKAKDEATAEKSSPKRVEKPVVTGKVVQRKKPLGKKFMETFFGGEDVDSVIRYVIGDVLIPAAKDTVSDAISQGIERMLFGETRSTRRQSGYRSTGPSGYTSYNRMSSSTRNRDEPRQMSRRSRANHDFNEIILATRAEAEEVIERLYDLVDRYNQATVSDLYDLVGETPSFTDEKWGWTDLRGAGARRISGGYLLDLPRPEPLR